LPVAVAHPLRHFGSLQELNLFEVATGGFDVAHMNAEDLGNPGRLAEAVGFALATTIIETTQKMAQDGSKRYAPATAGDEANETPGHGDAALVIGDLGQH
jgi:hypothetical protein